MKALGLEPKKALEMEVVADSIVWVMESSSEGGIFSFVLHCFCVFVLQLFHTHPRCGSVLPTIVTFAEALLSQEPEVIPLHICHT